MRKILFTAILASFILALFFVVKSTHASGSLVGYWKLDETTQGASAVDSSGSGNNGTGVGTGGGPVPSTDVPSVSFSDPRSASFNGIDQYFNCGVSPSSLPSGSSARTIAAWIKGSSFGGGSGNTVAGWGNDIGGELSELRVNSSGKIEFHGNSNDIPGATTLLTGQWYYVATTVTSGGAVTLYVNGTQDGTGSVTLNTTEANCKIGRQPDFDGQYFDGLIDEVRIYNSALTGADIADLTAGDSGPGIPTPTPTIAPTSTPTPTPTPTPAPTATPAPSSNNNSGSSSSSNNTNTTCNSSSPTSAPNLFQISTSPTTATVYFSPVSPSSGYVISYGTTSDANQYSTSFNDSDSSGVVSYTINALSQNTNYYFKVQGMNGCMPGNWSQIVKSSTTGTEEALIGSRQASITSNVTPTPTPKGTITVIKKTETASAVPTIADAQPTTGDNGYSLAITVKTNGQPVAGATVELHSTPMRTTTDKDGIARFSNVVKGNHTVLLAYDGYSGQEKVNVSGEKKDIAINMTVQLNDTGFHSSAVQIVVGILAVIIAGLICFILFKKRRKKKSGEE